MNRLRWGDGTFLPGERELSKISGVRLYDGENKTVFDSGELMLTNFHLVWRDRRSESRTLNLHLSQVVFAEEESAGWKKSAKIITHLNAVLQEERDKALGPVSYSPFNYIKFSFREGGEPEFFKSLSEALAKKEWDNVVLPGIGNRKYRAGIVGIERQIQARHEAADKNISEAFEDLNRLMGMAKEMVSLAKNASQKIREKKGEISEDETIQFKSHLLSLGISDPVTKETHGSGDAYHKELAKQLIEVLEKPLQDAGGILALTDVYCRVNRARGLELISPEDLINACKMLDALQLPLRLHIFDSGVKVVQLASHNENSAALQVKDLLEEKGSLTADELSSVSNLSVVLAKERLLTAEKQGLACRDDSVEGLRFYPNLFITQEV